MMIHLPLFGEKPRKKTLNACVESFRLVKRQRIVKSSCIETHGMIHSRFVIYVSLTFCLKKIQNVGAREMAILMCPKRKNPGCISAMTAWRNWPRWRGCFVPVSLGNSALVIRNLPWRSSVLSAEAETRPSSIADLLSSADYSVFENPFCSLSAHLSIVQKAAA